MKRTKYAGGGDAVVTVNDVWLCLEDIQAVLKQRSRTLQQALDVLRGGAMPTPKSNRREVCCICNRPRQQCLGHKRVPIEWCPPATAEGALTHSDWARIGWKAF